MRLKPASTALLILILPLQLMAQLEERFFFVYNDAIPVLNSNGDTLSFPWSGGLNAPQFSEIDLNLDGILDLFLFDEATNKPSTFINLGIPGQSSYKYAPEYEHQFPDLEHWALLRDYDNDGRNDLFTYRIGGIKLYKNTSTKEGGISFSKITNRLYSNMPGKNDSTNIVASPQDIPLIDDIDSDGDLDVLVFDKLGLFIEFNQNKCIENGNCDKLDLWKTERCWGNFSENPQDNGITINAECIYEEKLTSPRLHAGSTIQALDIDGDIDKEILLGDVNSPNLGLLLNGGTVKEANMVSFTPTFPVEEPINMEIFPSPYYLDVNNDQKKDLIIAPLISAISENKNSVWLMESANTDGTLKFKRIKNNFMQEDMIEVGANSHPVIFDYNNDSLPDLLVSNYNSFLTGGTSPSQIHYYQNIGTKTIPAFKLITEDWETMLSKQLGQSIFPAFGDLNNDGYQDLIVGNEEGLLFFYKNNPNGTTNKFEGNNIPLKDNVGNDIDVGRRATPTLFDLNSDGLLDLIIGELNGNLNYYQNVGTQEAFSFLLISQTLGEIDLSVEHNPSTGITVPKFFIRDGQIELFLGSEWGTIYYYDNISNNLSGAFTLQTKSFQNINQGLAVSPELYDLNHDGFQDLIIGNIKGGLYYYEGKKFTGIKEKPLVEKINAKLFPNPASQKVFLDFTTATGQTTTIKVFDLMGKLQFTEKVKGSSASFNVERFSSGIYLVTLESSMGKQSLKLIKD